MKALMIYETSKEIGTGKMHYIFAIKDALLGKKHSVVLMNLKYFLEDKPVIREIYDLIFVCIDFKDPEIYDKLIRKIQGKYGKLIFLIDENDPIQPTLKFLLQKGFTNKFVFEFGPDNIKYIPLKKAFQNPKKKRIRRKIKNILVTFGGTDPSNYVNQFLDSYDTHFIGLRKIKVNIVIGIATKVGWIMKNNIDPYYQILGSEMYDLMKICDLAVCSGGNTLIELFTMGVPTIAIPHNEKEKDNIQGFPDYCHMAWDMNDIFGKLDYHLNHAYPSKEHRKTMSRLMQNRFDGKGVFRLLEEIGI